MKINFGLTAIDDLLRGPRDWNPGTPGCHDHDVAIRSALEKPDVADVTLKFDEPLPGNMEPGAELEFEGQPVSYTKSPFMVTFDVDM